MITYVATLKSEGSVEQSYYAKPLSRVSGKYFRVKLLEVSWSRLVWFSMAIPRHAFMLWLAFIKRLCTRDRLIQWEQTGDTARVFCRSHLESRNSLFFEWSFTRRVWKEPMRYCFLCRPETEWKKVVEWGLKNWKGKSLRPVNCRITWGFRLSNLDSEKQDNSWRLGENRRKYFSSC